MKLPGWMASMATGFMTATVQVGASVTCTGLPSRSDFTVSTLSFTSTTLPRTIGGPGGAAAGAWPSAAPASVKEMTAASVAAVLVMRGLPEAGRRLLSNAVIAVHIAALGGRGQTGTSTRAQAFVRGTPGAADERDPAHERPAQRSR